MIPPQGQPGAEADWEPTISREHLRLRASILARIRGFFTERGLLEVETPLLSAATVPDPHLASLSTRLNSGREKAARLLYLQTSPEYAMKRLLAAGSGAIFQLSKAFRDGETGPWHNPEFTILEWYRPGFDHHRLMDEVDELVRSVLGTRSAERLTYGEAFFQTVGTDPFAASTGNLFALAKDRGLSTRDFTESDRNAYLDFLFSQSVQAGLANRDAVFVYDFPSGMAALARIRPDDPPVAERFELLIGGVELANGYHELTDAAEQRTRFENDLVARQRHGLPTHRLDQRLLMALANGLPDCAGVALGVDRLVMLAAGVTDIREVLAFPIDRA